MSRQILLKTSKYSRFDEIVCGITVSNSNVSQKLCCNVYTADYKITLT